MMDEARTGKRLLLALMSQDTDDEDGDNILSEEFSVHGVMLAIGSILTLVIVLAMCACKDGKSDDKSYTNGKGNDVVDDDNIQVRPDAIPLNDSVENGGPLSNRSSANMSKHSRQASSASGNNIRPASTNLRELPEPPVDSHHHPHHHHHSRNTSSSGITVLPPPPPPSTSTMANGGGGLLNSSQNEEVENGAASGTTNGGLNLDSSQKKGDAAVTTTNEYDHFGPKTVETPSGYDQLGNVKIGRLGVSGGGGGGGDEGISKDSGGGGGMEVGGGDRRYHHYAQPKERTYDVVRDVKKDAIPLYHSDSFSQVKEEDPYNQIGESDNTVSNAVIKRIRQSMDHDDLYATIQGDSDGSFAVLAAQQSTMSKGPNNTTTTTKSITSGGGISPSDPSFIAPTTSSSPSTPPGDDDVEEEEGGEAEYAVVHKHSTTPSGTKATPKRNPQQQQQQQKNKKEDEDGAGGSSSISPYNTYRPPEPPRMYGHYAESGDVINGRINNPVGGGGGNHDDDEYEDGDLHSDGAKEHMYSKVSARESLASMSARYALNPYETLPDLPENTYATVEGGSGDGVIPEVTMRNNRPNRLATDENRLSQNSDTYAEIGISGGALTTSVISNTSTSSANNNNVSSDSSAVLGTSSGSSSGVGGGGAPIPPSLDSLHQMTKSQTSSEGDRLSDRMSDRYLASPDDWLIPGQLDGIGGHHHHHHHYHRADGSDEESYGTLTRTSGGAATGVESTINGNSGSVNNRSSSSSGRMVGAGSGMMMNGRQGTITDVESGEVTPIPVNNYETVEDDRNGASGRFVFSRGGGDGDLLDAEENDPNYESVDETRAKVALLKARENAKFSPPSSPTSPMYATPHELRRNSNKSGNSSGAGAAALSPTMSSPPPPAPHVTVLNVNYKDETGGGNDLNSSASASASSPAIDIDRPLRKLRRPNHDYEEVDLSPPSSPLHSHHQHPLSASAPAETVDPSLRERVLNSHTYEELPQVKLSKKDEKRKSDRSKKKEHSSLSTSEEKKKSKEEKKKSKLEEKKKAVAAASTASGSGEGGNGGGGAGAGASWDGSKKSDSWETNRTRL